MVVFEEVSYKGFGKALKLENGSVEIVVSTGFGPRILHCGVPGGWNIFATFPEHVTGGRDRGWRLYGGHRLWHAPEVVPRTYWPDNASVPFEWDGRSLLLTPEEESGVGVRKEIVITLDEHSPTLEVDHRIINTGEWEKELAVWALSVMAVDGEAIVPQEEFKPHPDHLAPARPMVLWHYTRLCDPRFTWGERYMRIRQLQSTQDKLKVGVGNSLGWVAYRRKEDLFIKVYPHRAGASYPDMGSNTEIYTQSDFLELETLSPMVTLPPRCIYSREQDASREDPSRVASHKERWGIFPNFNGDEEETLDRELLPLVEVVRG